MRNWKIFLLTLTSLCYKVRGVNCRTVQGIPAQTQTCKLLQTIHKSCHNKVQTSRLNITKILLYSINKVQLPCQLSKIQTNKRNELPGNTHYNVKLNKIFPITQNTVFHLYILDILRLTYSKF